MRPARIILADDHTLLLETCKRFLEPEFEVVGSFADGLSLVEGAVALEPDAIVLDIGMPIMNGLNAASRLKQLLPTVKLVYLTMNQDIELMTEAFRLGASGYILKTSAASELACALREVLRGRTFVTHLMTERIADSLAMRTKRKKPTEKLTLRQKEVLQLLAEGRTMKEVAFKLDVTPRTIAFHKYTMMKRLQVSSSAELVQFAIKSLVLTT